MINKRLSEIIDYFSEGNKSAFARLVGVSSSVIENVVGTRQGNPSYEVIHKISLAFAQISLDWLIKGEGEMLKEGTIVQTDIASKDIVEFLKTQLAEKEEKIEKLNQTIGSLKRDLEKDKSSDRDSKLADKEVTEG